MKHAFIARQEYDTNVLEGEESQARWMAQLEGQIAEALAADPPQNSFLVETRFLPTAVYSTLMELQYKIVEESYRAKKQLGTDSEGYPQFEYYTTKGLRISW